MENNRIPPSPTEGLLNELIRMVGPEVTAATWKKVNRAKAAFRSLEARAEAAAAIEQAKTDYVVTLKHPQHGQIKIARRASTAAEAEAAAVKLAPGFELVGSSIERTA
jgi:hypothetical protein